MPFVDEIRNGAYTCPQLKPPKALSGRVIWSHAPVVAAMYAVFVVPCGASMFTLRPAVLRAQNFRKPLVYKLMSIVPLVITTPQPAHVEPVVW